MPLLEHGAGTSDTTSIFIRGVVVALLLAGLTGLTGCASIDRQGDRHDRDADGVPTAEDECPDTPAGLWVDATGCAYDADNDRVPDTIDRCPYTPEGAHVDWMGCSVDTDCDGVADGIDRCPQTPIGHKVDSWGCTPDSDGDGVPDIRDECPGTRPGAEVDERGCEIVERFTLEGVLFDFDKATLRDVAAPKLDNILARLTDKPELKARIDGHTDAIASDEYNQVLSEARAKSVVDYLLERGIEPNRLSHRGFGESQPVATNKTDEGRQLNRRVEIQLHR